MTQLIRFLELLGSDPSATALSRDDYAAAVAALDVDDAQRRALLARDAAALERAGGASGTFMLVLLPAEPERDPDGDDDGEGGGDDGDDDGGGDGKPPSKSASSAS
jgi:hypothetical protein